MLYVDEFQRDAVKMSGPTLCIAGPGTGKTTTLLARAANVERPLILTFTRLAAENAGGMTVHAFCRSLLGNVTVWDRYDSLQCLQDICGEMSLSAPRFEAMLELKQISWRKSRGLKVAKTPWGEEYEFRKQKAKAYDFGDLLLEGLEYVSTHDIRSRYGEVLVDEFQDLSYVQYQIIRHVCSDNLFVVGDPYQSIYGWRDAYPTIFDEFRQDYSPREVSLLNDYRHGPEILGVLEWFYPRGLISKGPPGHVEVVRCIGRGSENAFLKKYAQESDSCDMLSRAWAPLMSLQGSGIKGEFVAEPENEDWYPGSNYNSNVRLRTIHSAKGLEFADTIVMGVSEGVWPAGRIAEEEDRIFYVALSRAKTRLTITHQGSASAYFFRHIKRGNIPCPSRSVYLDDVGGLRRVRNASN